MGPDPHSAGYLVGQLLGALCCAALVLLPVAAVLVLLLRRRGPAGGGGGDAGGGFTVPSPDATWSTRRFPGLGLQLSTPPGVTADEVGGQVRLALPSGYEYRLVRGELGPKLAERRAWLEATPHRTDKRVLLAAPDAFAYRAREGELTDLSFVAGRAVGGTTWLVETHGARVEHGDLLAQAAPADQARLAQLQQQLAAAFARGERPDGPVARKLMDELAAATASAGPRQAAPARVTALTPLECAQGIALVRSLRAG